MLLGDLLARFEDETVASETLLHLGDLAPIAALQTQADAEGKTPGAYAAEAMRRFSAAWSFMRSMSAGPAVAAAQTAVARSRISRASSNSFGYTLSSYTRGSMCGAGRQPTKVPCPT